MEKKCIYCGKRTLLVIGKKYCSRCKQNCFKECIRCHLPHDKSSFYTLHKYRCNSCQRKYEKEKMKRKVVVSDSEAADFPSSEEENIAAKFAKKHSKKTNLKKTKKSIDISDSESMDSEEDYIAKKKKKKPKRPVTGGSILKQSKIDSSCSTWVKSSLVPLPVHEKEGECEHSNPEEESPRATIPPKKRVTITSEILGNEKLSPENVQHLNTSQENEKKEDLSTDKPKESPPPRKKPGPKPGSKRKATNTAKTNTSQGGAQGSSVPSGNIPWSTLGVSGETSSGVLPKGGNYWAYCCLPIYVPQI